MFDIDPYYIFYEVCRIGVQIPLWETHTLTHPLIQCGATRGPIPCGRFREGFVQRNAKPRWLVFVSKIS